MNDNEHDPSIQTEVHHSPSGRTGWDFATAALSSRLLQVSFIVIILLIIIWIFKREIALLPIYIPLSMIFSIMYYSSYRKAASRKGVYVEVWDKESNIWTTYRLGRKRYAELSRDGIMNQVFSLYGNSRVFAYELDLENDYLKHTWVHGADIWRYHMERRTLFKLEQNVLDVLDDINVSEAAAEIEGRKQSRKTMRAHYKDMDDLFMGSIENLDIPPMDEEVKNYGETEMEMPLSRGE